MDEHESMEYELPSCQTLYYFVAGSKISFEVAFLLMESYRYAKPSSTLQPITVLAPHLPTTPFASLLVNPTILQYNWLYTIPPTLQRSNPSSKLSTAPTTQAADGHWVRQDIMADRYSFSLTTFSPRFVSIHCCRHPEYTPLYISIYLSTYKLYLPILPYSSTLDERNLLVAIRRLTYRLI